MDHPSVLTLLFQEGDLHRLRQTTGQHSHDLTSHLSATIFHVSRREFPAMGFVLVLFVLAAFVAYGRWALVPFL